jgi:hypothetical protein
LRVTVLHPTRSWTNIVFNGPAPALFSIFYHSWQEQLAGARPSPSFSILHDTEGALPLCAAKGGLRGGAALDCAIPNIY